MKNKYKPVVIKAKHTIYSLSVFWNLDSTVTYKINDFTFSVPVSTRLCTILYSWLNNDDAVSITHSVVKGLVSDSVMTTKFEIVRNLRISPSSWLSGCTYDGSKDRAIQNTVTYVVGNKTITIQSANEPNNILIRWTNNPLKIMDGGVVRDTVYRHLKGKVI